MILYNKYIFSELSFEYPIFLTTVSYPNRPELGEVSVELIVCSSRSIVAFDLFGAFSLKTAGR